MSERLDIQGLDQATMTAVVNKLEDVGGKRIGLKYLPFKNFPTEEIQWDIVKNYSPLASFRAVDGESEIVGRKAFDRAYADIVSISRKERFNTSDLRKIREAGSLNVNKDNPSLIQQMANQAKGRIREALQRNKLAVDNRIEWMAIQAMQGNIDSPSNSKIKFSVDYGFNAGQKGVRPTNLWSDLTNSTPIKDLQDWMLTVQDNTGIEPDTVIMSRQVLNYITNNENIKGELQYTNPLMNKKRAMEIIEENTGLKIELYDSTYTDESNSDAITRFLPKNIVIMLPSKNVVPAGLGFMARASHPLNDFKPGYYTWTEEVKDPYGIEGGVGMDCFPAITQPEAFFTADVYNL